MGSNKRLLKAFVRYDGNGEAVSVILSKEKPDVGHWVEIPAYECCITTTSTTTVAL